jgi:hypothetical protein
MIDMLREVKVQQYDSKTSNDDLFYRSVFESNVWDEVRGADPSGVTTKKRISTQDAFSRMEARLQKAINKLDPYRSQN